MTDIMKLDDLINATADVFGVSREALLSKKRTDKLAHARFAGMLVMRRRGYSFPRIALEFSRDDHTTIIHAIGRALTMERGSEEFAKCVQAIADASAAEHNAAAEFAKLSDRRIGSRGRKRWEPADMNAVKDIIRRYTEEGQSLLEISTAYGVGTDALTKWLKGMGVPIKTRGGHQKKPDARVDEMLAMRKAGATYEEIGEQFGFTRERARQIAITSGRFEEFKDRPPRPEEIAIFERYKNEGVSIDYVASKLGVSSYSARKQLVRAGYEIRPSARKIKTEKQRRAKAEKIAERYKGGASIDEICEEFGLNHQPNVYRWLALAGVKPDRKPGKNTA